MTASDLTDGATITLSLAPGPEPATDLWFAVAIAAMVLIAACLLAWRRARSRAPQPRRRARILWTSAACSAGLILIMVPTEPAGLNGGELGLYILFRFLLGMIAAVMLFGTADLMLDYFRPRRSLIWLLISPILFTAFIVGILGASGWLEMIDTSRAGPTPVAALLAAGIIYWSFLPTTRPPVPASHIARIFE